MPTKPTAMTQRSNLLVGSSARVGSKRPVGSGEILSPGASALLAELDAAGVRIRPNSSKGVRRSALAELAIGARDLARHVAALATRRQQLWIVGNIRRMAKRKNNPRLVMKMCQDYAAAMKGRRGFSALRLYNLYYAVSRKLQRGRRF